jgi:hypothetical protein
MQTAVNMERGQLGRPGERVSTLRRIPSVQTLVASSALLKVHSTRKLLKKGVEDKYITSFLRVLGYLHCNFFYNFTIYYIS